MFPTVSISGRQPSLSYYPDNTVIRNLKFENHKFKRLDDVFPSPKRKRVSKQTDFTVEVPKRFRIESKLHESKYSGPHGIRKEVAKTSIASSKSKATNNNENCASIANEVRKEGDKVGIKGLNLRMTAIDYVNNLAIMKDKIFPGYSLSFLEFCFSLKERKAMYSVIQKALEISSMTQVGSTLLSLGSHQEKQRLFLQQVAFRYVMQKAFEFSQVNSNLDFSKDLCGPKVDMNGQVQLYPSTNVAIYGSSNQFKGVCHLDASANFSQSLIISQSNNCTCTPFPKDSPTQSASKSSLFASELLSPSAISSTYIESFSPSEAHFPLNSPYSGSLFDPLVNSVTYFEQSSDCTSLDSTDSIDSNTLLSPVFDFEAFDSFEFEFEAN